MQARPHLEDPRRVIPIGVAGLLVLPRPALASPLPEAMAPWLPVAILGLMGLSLVAALTLAALAYRRSLRPPPAPPAAFTREEMEEMRRSVTAFAGLLREGSATLLKHQQEALLAVERVAAHSQQLIALIAGCEERTTNATARGEILATRVARSAAAEIKASTESLTAISARIEHQARALEEVTRPAGARAA